MNGTEIIKLLDNFTDTFFPETGGWNIHCFDKKINKQYNKENLPCNLRNINWLTGIFSMELTYIPKQIIKEYILTSAYFNLKREEYEQKIVSWQIDYMNNNGKNWIIDENLGGDLFAFSPFCGYAFRRGIVDILLGIGMSIDAIEMGIEKNSSKWREKYMALAFNNTYNPLTFGHQALIPTSQMHYNKWMKMRLYEYYIKHSHSIEKYGEVLPEMKMTKIEITELKELLEKENINRLKEIERNKVERTKTFIK